MSIPANDATPKGRRCSFFIFGIEKSTKNIRKRGKMNEAVINSREYPNARELKYTMKEEKNMLVIPETQRSAGKSNFRFISFTMRNPIKNKEKNNPTNNPTKSMNKPAMSKPKNRMKNFRFSGCISNSAME